MDLVIAQEEFFKETYSSWQAERRALTRRAVSGAEFSQYPSRDVKKRHVCLVHHWKDLLLFNLSFPFETPPLFPCLPGVGVLPRPFGS